MPSKTNNSFDLIIIGGGPAGYVAAIRAAQLGLSVACVERDALGGVCLNWGCIPTKALLAGAAFYHKLTHDAESWGITAENISHNWEKVIGRSRAVANNLSKGIGFLFKKNKITHFDGHAFISPGSKGAANKTVLVYDKNDTARKGNVKHELTAKNIMIATGAIPRELPGTPFDGDKVIAAKEAMTLTEQPKELLIIGSGAIGMEFAYFYNAFGTKCTVIEMQDRILPIEDADSSKAVAKAFKKQGIKVHTGHITKSIEVTKTGIRAEIGLAASAAKASDKTLTIEADKVLVAIGVRGRYDGLFDDALGLELYKDHIKVDARRPGATYETNIPGIFAVGDVIGPPWLAHVASEEAILCVERIVDPNAGHDIDYHAIPGCTYCHPQIASIGKTEQACKDDAIEYTTSTFPFQASGKAQAMGETAGFVKLITGKPHGEILGAHMVGENVTELIAEIGLGMKLETTVEELIATMHAHPTLSEAVHEAALGIEGRMIHF